MSGNRIRIIVPNRADTAQLFAAPSFATENPVSVLQQPTQRGVTGRTVGLGSQDLLLYWTSDQKVNCAGASRTNLTTGSTLRTRLYGVGSPNTLLSDTGALAAYSTAGLDTDVDDYTSNDFAGYRNTIQYFAQQTVVRQAIMTFVDAANPAGYLSLTRLWVGKYFEFTYDPVPFGGAELKLLNGDVAGQADDGTDVVDKRWRARSLSLDCRFIRDVDLPTVLAIARRIGRTEEVYVDLYPGLGGAKGLYNQMACRLIESPTFSPWSEAALHGAQLVFKET